MPASAVGKVSLVLTSPPYGRGTHGLIRATKNGVHKRDHTYRDREQGNLAYAGWPRLQIVLRASVFGLMAVGRARADGFPVHLVAHEDVLILRRHYSVSSTEFKEK